MASFRDTYKQIKHAWNAFMNLDMEAQFRSYQGGVGYSVRPDRVRLTYSNERSILSSILTRLALDVTGVDMRHVRLDENGRYLEDVDSGLNYCLTTEANIDRPVSH